MKVISTRRIVEQLIEKHDNPHDVPLHWKQWLCVALAAALPFIGIALVALTVGRHE